MRLSLKILLPALLSILLLTGIGVYVLITLQQQQESLDKTGQELLEISSLVTELRLQRATLETNLLQYLLSGKKSCLDAMDSAETDIAMIAALYAPLAGDERNAALLQAFLENHSTTIETRRELIHNRGSGDAERSQMLMEKWSIQRERVDSSLRDLGASRAIQSETGLTQIVREQKRMRHTILVGILLSVLVLTVAFMYIRSNVSNRLEDLVNGARLIGGNNLAHRIGMAENDEIGALATAFDDMAGHLQTSRTQIEQRLQERDAAIQELEAFCYSVSHDLRAPLRAVDGFAQLTVRELGTAAPARALQHLQRVRDSAQQMGTLIDDLLALSRFSRQPLTTQNVAAGSLVQECLQTLSSEYDSARTCITIGEIPPCEGDPHLLKQVWINLISNALKYSSKRDAARVEIGSLQQADETVYFVRDNGAGFDMRYADKLFGAFQRLHGAREFPGNGVGLAIVQRIVNRHGGRVWAEAALNQGAAFFFTLGAIRHA